MKKTFILPLLSLSILFFDSCKEDNNDCLRVRYVSTYCPKQGAVLVDLLSGNRNPDRIALLNIPENLRVKDKVFYVTYYYDAALDKADPNIMCPAIYGPAKIFVSDSASEKECR